MTVELPPACGPDVFRQLAAADPYQRRARRLFERGQVVAVSGNEADVRVGFDAQGNPLQLEQVPIISGYLPRVGDWVAIQYEAGHSAAPWVTGPSMAEDSSADPAGIGVFSVSASEPSDPQKSTMYFDEARSVWRGWDGSDWVDLTAKLHNALPDLQGGAASQYYHFTAAEHGALQEFYDGSAMASGYLKKLCFKAIDASATSRTRLFEKDGDFYWAINAEYEAGSNTWNRIDTAKYAYLIGLYSKNGIPHEPGDLGGVVWWRATPGANPIGDYTAVGGWELGFMMTQHRNFVGGGMNWELDGSGSPPYGRFSQAGHEDPDDFTGIMRNVFYEGNTLHSPPQAGEGSWGRDTTDHPCWFAGIVDAIGFLWRYKAPGAGSFATSAWSEVARLTATGALTLQGGITLSGTLLFGADTNLYRGAPDRLQTDDNLYVGSSIALLSAGQLFASGLGVGSVIANIYASGDAQPRLRILNTGRIDWGPGGASTPDVSLQRHAAGVLRIGIGTADRDYGLCFDGETNDGAFYWMEDEDHFSFSDDICLPDGENLIFGTGTGTRIGTGTTQKMGFWNAAPAVQPAHVANADGTLADVTAKFNTLLSRLETVGILASA